MPTIHEIEGFFPLESSYYTPYLGHFGQEPHGMVEVVRMVYPNPRNRGRAYRSVRYIRPIDLTSPFAFHPTATLVDLFYQAKTLPQEIDSIEITLSNSRADPHGRLNEFLVTHPGHVLTKEGLWDVSVENDIYITEKNAAVKGIKQRHPKVVERLGRVWVEETDRWRQVVVGLKVEGTSELARTGQVDEWYWRVERIGRWVQELLEVKNG